MGIRKEKYSEEKISRLKKYLELYHNLGKPVDYEIVVDQFKIERRTDDLVCFDN